MLVAAGGLACLTVPLVASPAAASSMATGNCSYSAVYGAYTGFYTGQNTVNPLRLRVLDTKADGHGVAIRLVTRTNSGADKAWSWHHYKGGNGGEQSWDTSATDSAGISSMGIQAAVFEGDDLLSLCTSSFTYNPY
ncbi:hypothetical protein ACFW9D_17370 [Streptomyces sp. NPDC059524]|uniref:hypothetical protein n=1 Tax=Streptomyces sp. NPDC059524 TaxID=3346856 RepID=UPI0036B52F06